MLPAAQILPGATLRDGRVGQGRPRQADPVPPAGDRELRRLGGEQLIAESTPARRTSACKPVVGEPIGPPDAYGAGPTFVAIGEHEGLDELEQIGRSRSPRPGTTAASRSAASSSCGRWPRRSPATCSGSIRSTSPTWRPRTPPGRSSARALPEDLGFDDLGMLLKQVNEGDYVAILAYRTDPETEDAIERVCLLIRDRHGGDHDRFAPVPALDLAASTRAARTAACSSRWRTPVVRRPTDPGPALHVRDADRTRKRSATWRFTARTRTARRPRRSTNSWRWSDAARDGRPRPDGREPHASADAGRPRGGRVRRERGLGGPARERGLDRDGFARGPRQQAFEAARGLGDLRRPRSRSRPPTRSPS